MTKFYTRLSYSLGNEDCVSEQTALDIRPVDKIVCITASGDRPLNLLVDNCRKMVCVDKNNVQNQLLKLKSAAINVLSYSNYVEFLGLVSFPESRKNRNFYLGKCFLSMSVFDIEFWRKPENKKIVINGIIYQGYTERLCLSISKFFRFFSGKSIDKLFNFNDLHSQREFLQNEWNSGFFKTIFKFGLNNATIKIMGDPGFKTYCGNIPPGEFIFNKMMTFLENNLAKSSILLCLLFNGKLLPEAYSCYIEEESFYKIKKNLLKVEITNDNIIEYLENTKEKFDCFSLSDVSSYLDYENFKRLLSAIVYSSNNNSRICLRQFMSKYDIPQELQHFFQRDYEMENALEQNDSCFLYTFIVAKVVH